MTMSDNSSFDSLHYECFSSTEDFLLGFAINTTRAAFLVPVYIFVFYLGFQQWRQQSSSASHSDIFTYHLAAFELIWLLAMSLHIWAVSTAVPEVVKVTYFFKHISWYGGDFLHVLTCVEHYLAVVHPIVYMRLRNARGVRIRNISIVCVWILSPVCSAFNSLSENTSTPIPFLVLLALCLVLVSFCSLSVLYVLIRPGPGEGNQDRVQADQTKRRAFWTITAILVVLLFWFGGLLVLNILYFTVLVRMSVRCVLVTLVYMCSLPSGLVLPLLYLHRAGKLTFCFHSKV